MKGAIIRTLAPSFSFGAIIIMEALSGCSNWQTSLNLPRVAPITLPNPPIDPKVSLRLFCLKLKLTFISFLPFNRHQKQPRKQRPLPTITEK